jgi:hypothetical protein
MNKFRKLGFLEYNGGLHIHSSLLNVLLHDKTPAGPHGDASTGRKPRRPALRRPKDVQD